LRNLGHRLVRKVSIRRTVLTGGPSGSVIYGLCLFVGRSEFRNRGEEDALRPRKVHCLPRDLTVVVPTRNGGLQKSLLPVAPAFRPPCCAVRITIVAFAVNH
jgi:hypothetical protein